MAGVSVRLKKELSNFTTSPPEGISCHLQEGSTNTLDASIMGPTGSPYERGVFNLEIVLPPKYPFLPPSVKFVTPIFHPNIDEGGRICMDVLKMPPKGSWRATLTIVSVLASIKSLISCPNPDDPLVTDIANLYKSDRSEFEAKARQHTALHAIPSSLHNGPPSKKLRTETTKT